MIRFENKIVVSLALIGIIAIGLMSHERLLIHSSDNHFVYQADAWLNGSLSLTRRPHHQNDWASYETLSLKGESAQKYGPVVRGFYVHGSKKRNHFRTLKKRDITIAKRDIKSRQKTYYMSFPPGPALLLAPFVWLFGYGANDVILTIIFAGLNLALVYLLVTQASRRAGQLMTKTDRIWLSVFFVFSTCHLWLAVQGKVWFTALIVGSTFHLLYLYFALGLRRPLLAGLCLAIAFSSRATLLFSVFFIALEFWHARTRTPAMVLLKKGTLFIAPCLVIGVSLLVMNSIRFENPLEFGHTYLAGGNLQRIRDIGLFDASFVGRNLSAMFTLAPKIITKEPYLLLSKHGMSVLITSPALIFLLLRGRRNALSQQSLFVAAVLLLPILLYQNTGWEQFSYRFLLDLMPLLMITIAAKSIELNAVTKTLIIVGVLINCFGALTFQQPEFAQHYREFLPTLF